MNTSTFQPERLDLLTYWINERQSIADTRAAGWPPPWTTDPIMANTRWCNVRRMDDKVSQWLLNSWYPSNTATVSRGTMLAAVGLARLFNWPDSLDGLRGRKSGCFTKWDRVAIDAHFHRVKASGRKTFTNAYIINGALGGRGSDKIETVLGQIDEMTKRPDLLEPKSMKATWTKLQTVPGIGSFMAGQMVADLRHVWPGEWHDRHTFAPLGPGSRRGIAWLQGWDGIEDLKSMRQERFEELINTLRWELMKRKSLAALDARLKLELHDYQNGLCEYDKFMRISTGTGRAKNGYVAR